VTRKLVVMGVGSVAELAHFYFSAGGEYQPAAFCVDPGFAAPGTFCGLPVVPYAEVAARFPPASHNFFVAIGYNHLNEARKAKYLAAKALGYRLASFVSPRATVLNGGRIGDNCLILEDNTIQPFVTIGNNVTLWSGNHIGHHSTVGDHCFITSHVVVSGGVTIGECCFLGVNATLRDRIVIGERCVIGAGALLLADAAPEGVYGALSTPRSKVPSTRLRKI
jgi:sugar O-acyltransferase (sialic acid O-acetyltransferase NeuD family)